MKSLLVRSTCLSLVAGLWTAAHAQSDNIPIDYIRQRDWTFAVGARMSNEGAKVKFGRLGSVPSLRNVGSATDANVTRVYDNGAVGHDEQREIEKLIGKDPDDKTKAVVAAINDPSDPNHRYITQAARTKKDENGNIVRDEAGNPVLELDSNGNAIPDPTGNFLKYQSGLTRNWSYASESQLSAAPGGGDQVALSTYSATTDGASLEAEGDSGAGVEIALGRRIGRIGQRIEWGITGVIGITDINVKTSGTVRSTLHTLTDFYSFNGQAAPRNADGTPILNAPSAGDFVPDPAKPEQKFSGALETTVPWVDTPTRREETDAVGGAEVEGHWQVKGSYYLIRLGPNVRAMLTERISLNASVGFAGAYLGTKYRVDERLIVPGLGSELREQTEDEDSQFIAGFYGELTAEFWLTERTGFYAGATYENLGDYEQVLNGRTAEVELSSGIGLRFGITTRF
ncbi:MAG TPA: hypothetical protein VGD81_09700 [Opitutaceae bacterium]